MNLRMLRVGAALALAQIAVTVAAAQVTISPPAVLLGEGDRIGSYLVRNPLDVPQEVSVDFRFGYPSSDSLGNLRMEYADSAAEARFSLAPWIRAFPRQFVLPAGGEQVVRLMARPPAGLEDGVYWTRLVTTSTAQAAPVGSSEEGVSAQIILRFEQITSVLYRRGAVSTGVEVGEPSVHGTEREHHLLVPLTRTGTAPFLGTVAVRIRDGRGAVVHENSGPVAVYFGQVHRVVLPAEAWSSGASYTAEVRVTTERIDLPRERLPQAPPVTARLAYRVP